ncbi:LANO_0G00892g1_1 [Lachancea nothofagi CBS 11611]|uniref:peptidylprolyl isomerase n=1 Tax=Lachancea nothofagi CBS 11611 TaxID=1266666 RepID=A0A1G4KEE9_9SACH|nr:LANO_0G00892g1_1 [Lachancea nothofagi CBS 11611]
MYFIKALGILAASSLSLAGNLTVLDVKVVKDIPASECKIQASNGDIVSVHYSGSLEGSSEVFDSSYGRGVPIQFELGSGQVIQGWDEGILGMCIGEERELRIPSKLGYGSRGAGAVIPPDSDLFFRTSLVDIRRRDEL